MDEAQKAQEAIDYYRQQYDALGSHLLRIQFELRSARRDAQRQRVIAAIMQRLYTVDGEQPADTSADQWLGESLVALLIESLQVDCAALLRRRSGDRLAVEYALGLDASFQLPIAEPFPEYACSCAQEQVASEVRAALASQGLRLWLWSTSPGNETLLLLGHRHQQLAGVALSFEAGDQAVAKAVLSGYLAVTGRRAAKRALHRAKIDYHTLFESAHDAFVVIDASSNRVLEVNSRALALLGVSLGELQRAPLLRWLADPAPARWYRWWRKALAGRSVQAECRLRNVAGAALWIDLRLIRIGVRSSKRLLLVGHDITKHKQSEALLREYAFRDELTRLPNRAHMTQRLKEAMERQRKEPGYRFALFFLDLDRFKTINNSFGHSMGDRLLVLIGQRLHDQLRPTDSIARLGGDEFLILMGDIEGPEAACAIARRFEDALLQPFTARGQEIFTSASIGIVLAERNYYQQPEAMLRDADIAMHRAKRHDRGEQRYALFDPTMHARALADMELERDLRRALERREFLLYYQPIVELTEGRIQGFEALIRWRHPERGLVGPSQFIPLAEETLLILDISRYVLTEACRQALIWAERLSTPLTLNVNLSGRQFISAEIAAETSRLVAETGCPSELINLEITESAILNDKALALTAMEGLHSDGFRLTMDDFGTGYSSLSSLHQFPFDSIKIDRSFVNTLTSAARTEAIVTAILRLAETLEKHVVAEGIETPEQLTALRRLGCDSGQGYLFSQPVDAASAEALLEQMPWQHLWSTPDP